MTGFSFTDFVLLIGYIIPGICLGKYWIQKLRINNPLATNQWSFLGLVYLTGIVLWPVVLGVTFLQPHLEKWLNNVDKSKQSE